jgi:hypothetical protein
MPFLAFPLRLREDGVMRRCEEASAMLRFLQIMAVTPNGSWRACPSFGMRDLLEEASRRSELCRVAVECANQAFSELDIAGYFVEEIVREGGSDSGTAVFAITIRDSRNSLAYAASVSMEVAETAPLANVEGQLRRRIGATR